MFIALLVACIVQEQQGEEIEEKQPQLRLTQM